MKAVRFGSVLMPPVTVAILAVLLVMFLIAGVAANFVSALAPAVRYVYLSTPEVMDGQVWRLVSYALLHRLDDPFHLLLNGLMIGMFGRELETRWGVGRYLVFAFLTVLVGGLFVVANALVLSGAGVAVGASAFAEGLIVAWGLTYRDRPVRLLLALEVRGIHMVGLALFLWLLQAVSTSQVSAAAHLGGIVTAFVLVQGVWRPNAVKSAWLSLLERLGLKKKPPLYVVPAPKGKDGREWVN